jgi:hypothetical protein
MQKPHSSPQLVAIQILPQANENSHELKYPLKPSKQRASQESWSQERTVVTRQEIECENSPVMGYDGPTHQQEKVLRIQTQLMKSRQLRPTRGMENQSLEELSVQRASRTHSQLMMPGCSTLSHGQNCPPHSSEETYKRRIFSRLCFIHFCNGCSARDTRPKNFN